MSHINTFLLVPTSCFTANQITDKKKNLISQQMKIIIGRERVMENDDIFYNLFNSFNRKFQLWCVAMETTQYRSVSVQTPKIQKLYEMTHG
jgi:hypothetical protein